MLHCLLSGKRHNTTPTKSKKSYRDQENTDDASGKLKDKGERGRRPQGTRLAQPSKRMGKTRTHLRKKLEKKGGFDRAKCRAGQKEHTFETNQAVPMCGNSRLGA